MDTYTDIYEYEMELNWKNHYYGRCILCGNCYDKDAWRNEYDMFSMNVTDDYDELEHIEALCWTNQAHEGNGICYDCLVEKYNEYKKETAKKLK